MIRSPHLRVIAVGSTCALLLPCCTAWDLDRVRHPVAPNPQEQAPPSPASQTESNEELAKKTQNPLSDLISVPLQINTNFGLGPDDETQNILNIQPVVPVPLSEDWNLINRVIMPIIYQPEIIPGEGSESGLGDTNYTAFFSPADSGAVIWGVGPSVQIPTSTDDRLGSDLWGLGPSVIVLTMPDPWVIGAVANNIWSLGSSSGDPSYNKFFLQPFINYNFEGGWYLTTSPMITADWKADSQDRWTVPIGGGGGKIFRIGNQPINFQTQAFYNVEHPAGSAEWQLRFQLAFLF